VLPSAFVIGEAKVRQAQLPDVVISGVRTLTLPAKWTALTQPTD
jgi:hypothetical protein